MAVGQKLKKEVTEKILQAFEGSFFTTVCNEL